MAKETKIGLLAGLAFIICFAIILANRGQRPLITPMAMPGQSGSHTMPSAGSTTPPSTGVVTDASARQLDPHLRAGGKRVATPNGSPPGRTDTRLTPKNRPSALSVGSAGVDVMRNGALPSRATDRRTTPVPIGAYQTPQELTSHQLSQYLGLPEGADRGSTRRGSVDGDRQVGSTTRTAATQRSFHGKGRAFDTRFTTSRSSPSAAAGGSRRYTVVPGDTLSRIASAHYDTKSRSVIMAIFEANRAVLSSPDRLRPGVDLVLPTIKRNRKPQTAPGLTGTPASSSPSGSTNGADHRSANKGSPSSVDARASFRWYQIRSGDRYISIARDQLGDAARWSEIHELNKDKFPDPGRIRAGVRIKLPMVSAKVAQGKSR